MLRRLGVILALLSGLRAFEDVSFSARTLGLGGDQTAVVDDAFSSLVNPALSAHWKRPVVALSLPYGYIFNSSFIYVQPVTGLGTVGGSLFYRNMTGVNFGDRLTEADGRFFMAIPIGRFFSFGASLGSVSQIYSSESGGYPLARQRFEPGPILSFGGAISIPLGLSAGFSISEMWLERNPLLQGGVSWKSVVKNGLISSYLIAGNVAYRDAIIKFHSGCELFLLKDIIGLKAGFRYGSDTLSGFSPTFGVTIRTHRVEKTDFEIHYGMILDDISYEGLDMVHQLSLAVALGDARKQEKDSIKIAQAERARKLREQNLAREIDQLREELANISEERSALEKERKDIERLRAEALADLGRVNGIRVEEDSVTIRIRLTEQALRFEPGSAEIPFPKGYRTLKRVGDFLSHYPNNNVSINAHTDSSDIPEETQKVFKTNRELSSARADVIKQYLVEVTGISQSRITAKGLGDSEPLKDNETEEGRASNRRVEISVAL
ncbi:OmpA family protein [candidate division WOR-3 bacterium]|nr:OmpA family protein [candidate division WOR-3 bacterium]